MKATLLSDHEKSFFDTRKDSGNKEFNIKENKVTFGSQEEITFEECHTSDESFYYKCQDQEKIEKTQIVIHFTAGYLKGDVNVLTTPGKHVSVPFIIPRNGKILNMWDPSCWSYHLGLTSNLNEICNKQSIAIEISNIGYLEQVGNNLNTPYGDFYCTFDQTQYYQILITGFRNHKFFATYTEEQYKSLVLLLRYLTNKFNIPRAFLPASERFDSNPAKVAKFKGIVTHINYRTDKWDIGPAFDWDRVIREVS